MIGLAQIQSTYLAKCPYVWCWATYVRGFQKTGVDQRKSRKLPTIQQPNSPSKPKWVALRQEMSRRDQAAQGPKTRAQPPPLAKSP